MIFRIDDISLNTDLDRLNEFIKAIDEHYISVYRPTILLGVSCMAFEIPKDDTDNHPERLFPQILNAHSDHRVFYNVDKIGLPDLSTVFDNVPDTIKVRVVSHGLTHVDHRLLSRDVQEFNILCSMSILAHNYPEQYRNGFIVPFNKTNHDTLDIMEEHCIHLYGWDESWQHIKYLNDKTDQNRIKDYYFHTHDFKTIEDFKERLKLCKRPSK